MIQVTYRPATTADAAALARLRTAIREESGHGRAAAEADVVREFTEYATPDSVLLAEADGDLVGWAYAEPGGDGSRRFLPGGVLPAHQGRGIGRHLLGWQLDRFGPAGLPMIGCRSTDAATQALLRRFGLHPERTFLWMTRDVALPTLAATTDLTVAAYRPGDEHALWVAHQEGFADHYGFHPTPFEEWADRFPRDKRFRPDLSYAAWDGDELVAFASCYLLSVADEEPRTVVIEQVATRTPWRGRGAAGALLAAVIDAARAAGVPELALNVDGANPTGAVRIYERAGFVEAFRRVQFARP
ncbi:GNAT family N-acetyltransferase [Hamadaea sp. NPDC051192]|uniref:GNAT family N-acetyltransferase n=1 Tax=Hamadaea sp. NPDC051192 TaxID=3154940 RepID=UPI003447A2ED